MKQKFLKINKQEKKNHNKMPKLFDLVSEIELPSFYSIFCSSRRKYQRYETIIQQEKSKNEYLTLQIGSIKDELIESYIQLLEIQRKLVSEALINYEQIHKQYELVKELKEKNDHILTNYIITTIENIEEDWKKKENTYYELLEIEMKKFETIETKLKIVSNSI